MLFLNKNTLLGHLSFFIAKSFFAKLFVKLRRLLVRASRILQAGNLLAKETDTIS